METQLTVAPHPWLEMFAFTTAFPGPLRSLESPGWLTDGLSPEAEAPLARGESVRAAHSP